MTEYSVKEIVEFVASFLVDRTGNDIFDKWREKRKIERILKEDRKNIKRIFYAVDNSDLYNLIEEFIMFSAFKETFFYSSMDLTIMQEEILWQKFADYIQKETGDSYINTEYREKIIRCLNLHNKAINNIIMDEKDTIQTKMIQRQHNSLEDSLNYIINTLNTDTRLQDKDDELSFSIEQLDMIIKSYRFDINQLRKLQTLSICGAMIILLFMSIFVPLSLKYVENVYSIIVMFLFLSVIILLFLIFWKYISRKLEILEHRMRRMRDSLWEIHFKLYKNQIKNKYIRKEKL